LSITDSVSHNYLVLNILVDLYRKRGCHASMVVSVINGLRKFHKETPSCF